MAWIVINIEITPKRAEECRKLVHDAAKKHDVPPVFITAHYRHPAADLARKEIWRVMLGEMKMKRVEVATIFGRDRRRLRRSVLGV